MNWYEKLIDSYDHYRRHVGLNPVHAAYRAIRYEILGFDVDAREWK